MRNLRKDCEPRFAHGRAARYEKDDVLCHETKYGVYVTGLGSGLPCLNQLTDLFFVAQHADLIEVTPSLKYQP